MAKGVGELPGTLGDEGCQLPATPDPSMPWPSVDADTCRSVSVRPDPREASVDRCDRSSVGGRTVADFLLTVAVPWQQEYRYEG